MTESLDYENMYISLKKKKTFLKLYNLAGLAKIKDRN